MNVKIEKGTLADAPVIEGYIMDLFHEEHGVDVNEAFRQEAMGKVIDSLIDKTKVWLVARVEEKKRKRGKDKIKVKTVGQLLLNFEHTDLYGDIVSVFYLYIRPEYRNQGIFDALFAQAEETARASKASKAVMYTKPTYEKAFEARGFVPESVIMSKDLREGEVK
jgi:GNAT superfamily N-acetyltransferase